MRVFWLVLTFFSCATAIAQYKGTGSVTQGKGSVSNSSIFSCVGGRVTATGSIAATDQTTWDLPASVNFMAGSFPFASDLYNPCNGATYANADLALAALKESDIVQIEPGGELVTAFVFADNYFEMYINGVPVGKDKVPFTPFNSSIVRFRVKRPFTIAMLLVDWEEALGLGTELNAGVNYHPGDGGMVAVFRDSSGTIIAATDQKWKAQTYYTAPVKDLACPVEQANYRYTNACSTSGETDGSAWFGLHWPRPQNWMGADFKDTAWPAAVEYTNQVVGVDNKPAYTNFTGIFDQPAHDAKFIWSSNLILDNEVLVRYTVPSFAAGIQTTTRGACTLYPNPAGDFLIIDDPTHADKPEEREAEIVSTDGRLMYRTLVLQKSVDIKKLPVGAYWIRFQSGGVTVTRMFIKQLP